VTWSVALRALFVLYVAATALYVGWILAHEPFTFDAWNVAVTTEARPFSASNFVDFWRHEYTHSNPRIGQPLTYLAYKLVYFAPVASSLAMVALGVGVFVVGTGRWPAWRRGRDLALVTIAIGTTWFVLPEVGRTLFNRAYGANYFYSAVIQVWFLVPLRLAPEGSASHLQCVAYSLAAVLAGMANEHTGPTLCAGLVVYVWWLRRSGVRRPTLAWAGTLGFILGFAIIFFAPGQSERYEGLAQKTTLLGRLLQRGLAGNLEIIASFVQAAAPLLALVVAVLVVARREVAEARRTPLTLLGLAALASLAITATLFVSPKLGTRFFLFPMALLLAAFVAIADVVLVSPRRLAPFVLLAVVASGYAVIRTVPLYTRVSAAGAARLAALAAATPGTAFTAEAFEQVEPSWWFLGDDFRDVKKRELVADYFGLSRVVFRAYDRDALLGISDVRLVTRCEPAGAGCLEVGDWFESGAYRGNDLGALHGQLLRGIDRLRATPAGRALSTVEILVEFAGDRPALPRPRLLLARWRPISPQIYTGTIARRGRSAAREISLPNELPASYELHMFELGGQVTRIDWSAGRSPRYTPTKNGMAWALACDAAECFVVGVVKVGR
jgi:Family of unknown function (DUF6056)